MGREYLGGWTAIQNCSKRTGTTYFISASCLVGAGIIPQAIACPALGCGRLITTVAVGYTHEDGSPKTFETRCVCSAHLMIYTG